MKAWILLGYNWQVSYTLAVFGHAPTVEETILTIRQFELTHQKCTGLLYKIEERIFNSMGGTS